MKVLLTLLIEKLSDGGEEDAEVRFPFFFIISYCSISFHFISFMSMRSGDIYELYHWFYFAVSLFFAEVTINQSTTTST
jgi:hypothetical protein